MPEGRATGDKRAGLRQAYKSDWSAGARYQLENSISWTSWGFTRDNDMRFDGRKHQLLKFVFLAIQVCSTLSGTIPGTSNDSDPCENFYKHACENPAKNPEYVSLVEKAQTNVVANLKHVIQSINGQSDLDLSKKWQAFYTSCKNTEKINGQGVTPLNSILNNLGGWPLSNSLSADNLPKLQDVLSFYGKVKAFPLYELLSHDDKFHKKTKIMIRQPRTTFLEGIESAPQSDVDRYIAFIKRIIETVATSNKAEISQEEDDNVARQIVAFEIELSKILSARHEVDIYKPTILKDLQSKTDQDVINWKNIINNLSTVEFITDEDEIDVSTASYYPKLVKLLQGTPAREILNYVHWRFIVQYLPYTSDDLRSLYFENSDLLQSPEQKSSRSSACVYEPALDYILSYQYAKEYITPDIESIIHQVLNNIKEATIDVIKESSLLKGDKRRAAENRVSNMKFVFGVVEKARNLESISEFYDSWTVGENYFENILALRRFATAKEIEKIKKGELIDDSADNFMRITNLLDLGFKYDVLVNTVYIKPENLVSPLLSSDDSEVKKYGLLGLTIARGIMMAFQEADSIESYVDGKFVKLYTNETLEAYWNRSECFYNKFANDSTFENSQNIMADTSAIQIAHKALIKQTPEITPENAREFFTLFVKTVCRPELQNSLPVGDPQYRVMGSLPNVRQFAEAFECPRGVRMNPETICSFLN